MFGATSTSTLLSCLAIALAAGCAAAGDVKVGGDEQAAQPIDRLILGQAVNYPADKGLAAREEQLASNMAERRKAAWAIVEKVLAPAPIASSALGEDGTEQKVEIPRFQTWYAREDVMPMFDRLFRGLSDDGKRNRDPFPQAAIDEVFPWNATMATSLRSFTEERLTARRKELSTAEGAQSLGKDARVLMSPSYVSHLLKSYKKIVDCKPNEPRSASMRAGGRIPCLDGDFPDDAVAIKTRWIPSSFDVPTFDTSPEGLAKKLAAGTFGEGDGIANPTPEQAYTMRLNPNTTSRLVALHIMTKELRDWVWITLWWSPDPNSDYGADRPASLKGAFANYKMCVATAFSEKDPSPGSHFRGSLSGVLAAEAAAAGEGPSTWCSNPYLETSERAATTNCIGCHQHGGTGETNDTLLADETKFPNFTRTKVRDTFPSDYAFTNDGGLDLAAQMKFKIEALTP